VDGGDLNRALIALAQSPEGTLYWLQRAISTKSDGGDWSGGSAGDVGAGHRRLRGLLVGGSHGLFMTTDDGQTWVKPTGVLRRIRAVATIQDPNLMMLADHIDRQKH
jgi:hypothetical protein